MKDHHTNDQEEFEAMALPSGHIAQIVKDTSKLKGRLAKKFAEDSNYESAFGFDTNVSQFIKPSNHTKQ